MVAVQARSIPAFLKNPPQDTALILLYGPDSGLVSERALHISQKLAASFSPQGEILKLDDSDLAQHPGRIPLELQTVSMFGGRNIIRLKAGPRLSPSMLDEIFSFDTYEASLIIEAGDLKKSAKLRKLFETSKAAAAIPCYMDSAQDLGTLIDDIMADHNLRIDPQSRRYLTSLLGADRGLSRAEVEKLALYCATPPQGENKDNTQQTAPQQSNMVTLDDIDAIIGNASETTIDNIIYATLDGATEQALGQYQRSLNSGQSSSALLTLLGRHMQRMLKVRVDMDRGKSLEGAIKSLRPPLHFKREKSFSGQCQRWSTQKLLAALTQIQDTTKRSRQNASLEQALTERLLIALGQRSGR